MRAKTSLILPLILACAAWAQTPPAPQKTPGDTATPVKTAPKAPANKTKAAAPHKKAAAKLPAGKRTAAKTPAKAAQKAPAKTAVTHPKAAPMKPAAASQTKPAPVAKQPAASKAKAAPAAPAAKTATAAPQAKTAPSKAIAPQKKPAPVAKQGVGTPKSKSVGVAKQPFGAPKPKTAPVAKKAAATPTKTKAATKPAAAKSLTAKSKARAPRQPKLKGKAVTPSSKPAAAPVQRAATAEERLRPGVRRDPFISPVIRAGNVTPCTTGGKKCLAIGDIVLKGVAKTENGMLAVVENSARKAYFLRENDPVFNGFVVKITMDEVVLRESVMDRLGHTSTRDVIKRVIPLPVG